MMATATPVPANRPSPTLTATKAFCGIAAFPIEQLAEQFLCGNRLAGDLGTAAHGRDRERFREAAY
jgi:hypothetical protein